MSDTFRITWETTDTDLKMTLMLEQSVKDFKADMKNQHHAIANPFEMN